MEILTIVLILLVAIVLIIVIGGVFAYFMLVVPAMRAAPPPSEEDRAICRKLVKEWKAYPFLCRSSIRKGTCPCQPCSKLNSAKAK